MRKKLSILIPLLALFAFIAVAGTITIASSGAADATPKTLAKEMKQAATLRQQRNFDSAEAIYLKVIYENPGTDEALDAQKQIVYMDIRQKDIEKADADLQTLIENFVARPTLPKDMYQIAGKYICAGYLTKAGQLYTLAAQYSPDEMYVKLSQICRDVANDDTVSAFTNLGAVIEEYVDNSKLTEEIYNIAINCGYANQYNYSVQFYQQVIDSWPDSAQAPYAAQGMAIAYSILGDEDSADVAIESLKNDFGDFPGKAENFYELGQYYREDKKMYDKAIELYEYAVNNCSKDDDYTMFCQVELVKYYISTGNLTEAGNQYNKLINEFADNENLPSNICFIGDTYLRAGEIDIADQLYTYAANSWAGDAQTIFARAGFAKIAIYLNQDKEANQMTDELFTNNTDNPYVGQAILGVGEEFYNKGREIYKGDIRPGSPENPISDTDRQNSTININSGVSILLQAIADLEENVITTDYATNAEYYHRAGSYYHVLGDFEKSVEYYSKVVDNWPEYELYETVLNSIPYIYECMKRSGEITGDNADKLILDAYQSVIDNNPDSPSAEIAQSKIARHQKRIQMEKDILNRKPSLNRGGE